MEGCKFLVELLHDGGGREGRRRDHDPVGANGLTAVQLDLVAARASRHACDRPAEEHPRAPEPRNEGRHERIQPAAKRDERRTIPRHRRRHRRGERAKQASVLELQRTELGERRPQRQQLAVTAVDPRQQRLDEPVVGLAAEAARHERGDGLVLVPRTPPARPAPPRSAPYPLPRAGRCVRARRDSSGSSRSALPEADGDRDRAGRTSGGSRACVRSARRSRPSSSHRPTPRSLRDRKLSGASSITNPPTRSVRIFPPSTSSRSTRTTSTSGAAASSRRAAASPAIPPPTTATLTRPALPPTTVLRGRERSARAPR